MASVIIKSIGKQKQQMNDAQCWLRNEINCVILNFMHFSYDFSTTKKKSINLMKTKMECVIFLKFKTYS